MAALSARRVFAFSALLAAVGCFPVDTPRPFTGIVENTSGQPLAGAVVRLQGTSPAVLTGADGRYWIDTQPDGNGTHITAWKDGYYIGGAPLSSGVTNYRIQLKEVPASENLNYQWLPARASSRTVASNEAGKACEVCHFGGTLPVVSEWEGSAHGRSAVNPFFLSFFNGGSGLSLIPNFGYRIDFPGSAGNCANCHVPALALRRPYNADPNQATGAEREGVLCDLCHKIKSAEADIAGGRTGVLSMTFARPPQGEQIFIGSLDDVPTGADTFQPFYRDSRYCAGCHHGLFWGVLAYSEFSEWQASEAAAMGIHCQGCHMKPDGKTSQFAVASEGAIMRRPETIPSHTFPGRDNLEFMRSGIEAESSALVEGDRLRVQVNLRNVVGGHHIPTGSPMRNLVLLVQARDQAGRALELIDGGKVPVWAGEGPEEFGNYAGLPGRGYAKILVTPVAYPADPTFNDRRTPFYPAPHWRRIIVESDNRLPAGGSDATTYIFRMGPEIASAKVHVRLLHRRTFRSWLDPQTRFEGDLLLAEKKHSLQR